MTDTKPTFRVETEQGKKILLPQFQPSDLDDDQREVYDGLREAAPEQYVGAVAVNEAVAPRFEAGETVTLGAVVRRYTFVVTEAAESFRSFSADLEEMLAPVVSDLSEAFQPLVELQQDMAESIPEKFDE